MPPVDTLTDVAEQFFATSRVGPASEIYSMDPAERMEFSRPPAKGMHRFDSRSNEELREAMFDDSSALERERACWEFGDRLGSVAIDDLMAVAQKDVVPSVRWTTLWLIQKIAGAAALDLIAASSSDEHPEVRDWAALLTREIVGQEVLPREARGARLDPRNPFDQTLPLTIAGYARVVVPSLGTVQATLSPLWFESIMGRVMACTQDATFNTDLIVEKRIKGYHPDGTDHYEIYPFRGFSQKLSEEIVHHHYYAPVTHTFYPSGKVEDGSLMPIEGGAGSDIGREAMTLRQPVPGYPGRWMVESVRGRYMGVAYASLERLLENGMRIGPGEVQLASCSHLEIRHLTNTFLYGTFKGKASDLDGDGLLDVNTEWCHGTPEGLLDFDGDGAPDPDPFDPYAHLGGRR